MRAPMTVALVEHFGGLKTISGDAQIYRQLALFKGFLGKPDITGIVLHQ